MPLRRRTTPRVTIVTRVGCYLCQELEATVRRVAGDQVSITLLDLDVAGQTDPELLDQYSTRVPVLLVDDREVGHLRVDEDTIRSALSNPRDRWWRR